MSDTPIPPTRPQIGPTGEFPHGQRLDAADRGGLRAGLSIQGNHVRIDFGTPLTYLLATREQAIALADMLVRKAQELPLGSGDPPL